MTNIDFVTGFDSFSAIPEAAKKAGLKYRFAVIQDTYRPDKVYIYFDENLLMSIIDFLKGFYNAQDFQIEQRQGVAKVQLEVFLSDWNKLNSDDRNPPETIYVRKEQKIVACVATQYWKCCGGPRPYHDSYTYQLFSEDDISEKVITFLAEVSKTNGWNIAAKPIDSSEIGPLPKKKWFGF